jgi:hypothetical protein
MALGRERDSRRLAVLLTTPAARGRILWDWAWAVARRGAPAWLPLGSVVVSMAATGVLGLGWLVWMLAVVAWVHVFVIGAGLYLGVRLLRSGAAALTLLGLCAALWLALPVAATALMPESNLADGFRLASPVFQILDAPWHQLGPSAAARVARLGMAGAACLHAAVGVALGMLAARRLEKGLY